ncbi:hypothetical protein E5288_WYG008732 [Bos mutus]|uniref:Uncharacterized protein n=1 Tax=Bos mutus TaxID=72004 RepID=A0A6B0S5T6_9CETA|nr:hypothetical protein [Bos mutus]
MALGGGASAAPVGALHLLSCRRALGEWGGPSGRCLAREASSPLAGILFPNLSLVGFSLSPLPVKDVKEKPERQIRMRDPEKSASSTDPQQPPSALAARGSRKTKSPQRSSTRIKEHRHPFALYGWGEKQTDTGSQKTHNVCASAPVHEIHESALRAKSRRQVEKRRLAAQRQRAHSADVEKNRRVKPASSENPWMTEGKDDLLNLQKFLSCNNLMSYFFLLTNVIVIMFLFLKTAYETASTDISADDVYIRTASALNGRLSVARRSWLSLRDPAKMHSRSRLSVARRSWLSLRDPATMHSRSRLSVARRSWLSLRDPATMHSRKAASER